MLEMFKKSGLVFAMAGTFALGGAVWSSGCGTTSEDDDDASAGDDDTSAATATPDASPSPSPAPSPSPSPAPSSTVTFAVDTNAKADGVNRLAAVEAGEKLMMVGNFNGWTPQDTSLELKDDGTGGDATSGDGIFTIQLTFPLVALDGDKNAHTYNIGDTDFQYKFLKTTHPDTANAWGNGPKDFYLTATKACPGNELATGGLWQITKESGNSKVNAGNNLYLTAVPATDTTVTYIPDAFEDYTVKKYGYPVCQ